MNRLPSAKKFALSPFYFGKTAHAVVFERLPPNFKTEGNKRRTYIIRSNKKVSRTACAEQAP